MKVSQLTRRMSKSHGIVIKTPHSKILFDGCVAEIKKDNPLNSMFVTDVGANNFAVLVVTVDQIK